MAEPAAVPLNVTAVHSCVAYSVHREIQTFATRSSSSLDGEGNPRAQSVALVLLPLSLVCMAFGRHLLRPSFALIGFSLGGIIALEAIYSVAHEMSMRCDVVVLVTLAVSFMNAAWAVVALRAAIVSFAALTGGLMSFMLFRVAPQVESASVWPDSPRFLERNLLPFWAVSAIVAIAFGVVAWRHKDNMAIIVTALLGAYLNSFSVRVLSEGRAGDEAYFALLAGGATASVLGQLWLRHACHRRRAAREARRGESVSAAAAEDGAIS